MMDRDKRLTGHLRGQKVRLVPEARAPLFVDDD